MEKSSWWMEFFCKKKKNYTICHFIIFLVIRCDTSMLFVFLSNISSFCPTSNVQNHFTDYTNRYRLVEKKKISLVSIYMDWQTCKYFLQVKMILGWLFRGHKRDIPAVPISQLDDPFNFLFNWIKQKWPFSKSLTTWEL